MKFVLTCEHGGNNIPKSYQSFFENSEEILDSHRGYDLGALDVFKYLKPLADFSNFSETSRLVIELNRSLHHKNLFSEFTKTASKPLKQQLIESYYTIYRQAVKNYIVQALNKGETVIHLSVHSFTPVLNTVERHCDIGLLYDSSIQAEKIFCHKFKTELTRQNKALRIRYNYPYLGKADGFTSYLRKKFPENYVGIELEINQKFAKNNAMPVPLKQTLYNSLKNILLK